MEKSKLKELVKQVISEYLDEMSTSGAAGGYLGKKAFKPKNLNEARYSTFKKEIKTRTPQQQLHEGVKAIQRRLDEINRLVEFTSRMKAELKENDEGVMYLERTRKSLTRINEKIQEINEKINNLTE
jgi:tetrahydromethanopterin S-methyltransferase subunit G